MAEYHVGWHELPRQRRQSVPGPQLPGFVSAAMVLIGVWLVVQPFVWNYGNTVGGFDARVSDLVVGVMVVIVALARLTGRIRTITATVVPAALGGWLLMTPFLLGHGFGADSTRATVVDVLAGSAIVVLTTVAYLDARARSSSGP